MAVGVGVILSSGVAFSGLVSAVVVVAADKGVLEESSAGGRVVGGGNAWRGSGPLFCRCRSVVAIGE